MNKYTFLFGKYRDTCTFGVTVKAPNLQLAISAANRYLETGLGYGFTYEITDHLPAYGEATIVGAQLYAIVPNVSEDDLYNTIRDV